MRPRDLYGVLLRATGTGFIFFAVFDLIHIVEQLLSLPVWESRPIPNLATGGLIWLAIGIGLLLTAEWIVRAVYGPDKDKNSN